jgi:hypothetical protein
LEARRFAFGDVQGDLEAGVQDVKKTVGETPHEKPEMVIRLREV